ncbi:MAG: hypothetical protein JJU11_13745 [Candidatus Sumerlaeia bacterium]|nr:hypothetical protein [Candidatus Sumerlaeia bacterium]
MGFRKKTSQVSPTTFHPGASAPMGSLGDEWNGKMDFPVDPGVIQRKTREAERQRQERLADPKSYIFKDKVVFRPPLGWLAIHAWSMLVLGVISTGPLLFFRLIFSGTAVALGVLGWLRLKNRTELERGHKLALIAAILAAALILWELLIYVLGD